MASGGVNFNQTAIFGAPPATLVQSIVAGTTGTPEYTVMVVGPATVVLTRKYRPTWALMVFVVGLLLFLVGLLALLVTNTETLTVNVLPAEGGASQVTVSGVGSLPMLHRLAAILNTAPATAGPDRGPYELQAQPTASAGWYPEPYGGNGQRYWDGTQWTPHVLDGPTATTDAVQH